MAAIVYRANLSSSIYPMTIAEGGRTVIIPGPDNNFDRRVDPTGAQKDAGIPQALYLEDVMPTASGYQSVGYRDAGTMPPRYTAGVGYPETHSRVKLFFGDSLNPKVLTVAFRTAPGSYEDVIATTLTSVPLAWTQGTGVTVSDPSPFTPAGLTVAYVRGVNYIFDGLRILTATNPSGNVVNLVDSSGSVTGITVTDIRAICSCANYLIALMEDNTIAWSSTTTPLDFTASLVSGAGSQIPSDIQAPAMFLAEAPNAFYIYTLNGVVYASYTGNSRYPFKFTAVENSGGYSFPNQVSSSRLKAAQYAIDDSGNIRLITPARGELIAQELSTFLERQSRQDVFDTTTNTFSLVPILTAPRQSLEFILDKYILISVGPYFIVFDTLLSRYGKLKRTGRIAVREDGSDSQIHFLETPDTFECSVMSFDQYDTDYTFTGVLALGKFQYVRSRKIELHEIQIEGPQDTAIVAIPDFSCVLLPSLNGRTFNTPVAPYQVSNAGGLAVYNTHATAQNHTIVLKGAFNVSTVQLRFSPRGDT
jgi:hypothetical protein